MGGACSSWGRADWAAGHAAVERPTPSGTITDPAQTPRTAILRSGLTDVYLSISYFKSNDQTPTRVNPHLDPLRGAHLKRPRRDPAHIARHVIVIGRTYIRKRGSTLRSMMWRSVNIWQALYSGSRRHVAALGGDGRHGGGGQSGEDLHGRSGPHGCLTQHRQGPSETSTARNPFSINGCWKRVWGQNRTQSPKTAQN